MVRLSRRHRALRMPNSTGTAGSRTEVGVHFVTKRDLRPKEPGIDAVVSKLP